FVTIYLETAVDDSTCLQKIEFRSAQVNESRSTMTINGATLVNRTDVIFSPIFSGDDVTIDAPIVFAGFGAPDDYANIDARGKIVLVLSGANPKLPNDERAYYSSRELKRETAAAHGAIGMIGLNTITDEKRRTFVKAAAQASMKSMRIAGDTSGDAIRGSVSISREAAAKVFAGKLDQILDDAEKGIVHPFPLNVSAKIQTITKFSVAHSESVVARLKGKTDENVVVSAHLDHLGLATTGDDRVYNGALDNASGSAALIEIARAFAAL